MMYVDRRASVQILSSLCFRTSDKGPGSIHPSTAQHPSRLRLVSVHRPSAGRSAQEGVDGRQGVRRLWEDECRRLPNRCPLASMPLGTVPERRRVPDGAGAAAGLWPECRANDASKLVWRWSIKRAQPIRKQTYGTGLPSDARLARGSPAGGVASCAGHAAALPWCQVPWGCRDGQ
jgi:hypothetical protein